MDLEPVAGVRGDERPPSAVLLHAQAPAARPAEHGVEVVVVERHAEVVDARDVPVAGLDDDVDRSALELREAELERVLLELLPRDARLDGDVVLADPPVARDELEPELSHVARLDVPELGGYQVVVEEVHGSSLSGPWTPFAAHTLELRAAPARADDRRRGSLHRGAARRSPRQGGRCRSCGR